MERLNSINESVDKPDLGSLISLLIDLEIDIYHKLSIICTFPPDERPERELEINELKVKCNMIIKRINKVVHGKSGSA